METRQEALRMIDEGIKTKDIADALGVSPGRISQYKTEAISKGIMNKAGKLVDEV